MSVKSASKSAAPKSDAPNGFLRKTFICGVALAAVNCIVDVFVFSDYMSSVTTYEENADAIAEALNNTDTTTTSFGYDSEWYLSISAEYEALSDFDKEYVYCDVVSIMHYPDVHVSDAGYESSMGVMFAMFIAAGLLFTAVFRWATKHNAEVDAEMAKYDAENPRKKPMTRAEVKANLDERFEKKVAAKKAPLLQFRRESFFLSNSAGPALAIIWLMIVRRSSVTGLDCQNVFYGCGKSEDSECTMDDLMTTIALNSSFMSMVTMYPLYAAGYAVCYLAMLFILVTGVIHWIAHKNMRYAIFSLLFFAYSNLPFVWAYCAGEYLEDSFAPVWGVVVIAMIPVAITVINSCWSWCFRWLDTCLD